MSPLKIDRLYTFAALSRKSLLFQAISLFTTLIGRGPGDHIFAPLALGYVVGIVTAVVISHLLLQLGRLPAPGARPVNIHWSNTRNGVSRTTQTGYINGSWDAAVFKTETVNSHVPLLISSLSAIILGILYTSVGLASVAIAELASPSTDASPISGLLTHISSQMTVAFVFAAILWFVAKRTMRSYLLQPEPLSEIFPAIIALAGRSPMYLSSTTGRARHCIEMNGHAAGLFRWTQHNSAAGDRY